MTADTELIEIPIDELALGIDDETGMPKAVPGAKPATGKPIEAEGEPELRARPDPKLAALEKERDEAKAERDRLARERDAERSRAAEALERAEKADQALGKRTDEAVGAHRARVRSDYEKVARDVEFVTSQVTSAQGMLAQAEQDLAAAHTSGDAARIASLTAHVGKLTGQLSQLEAYKPGLETALAEAKQTWEDTERSVAEIARRRAETPAETEKPKGPRDFNDFATNYAEQWIDTTPRAVQGWLREHKADVIQDERKFKQLQAFANLYETENGAGSLNSRDFEKALDAKFFPKPNVEIEEQEADNVAETETETQEEAPKAAAKKSAPAAPVSRNASPARPQGGGAGSIKLSPEQYAIAPDLYPSGDYDGFSAETKKKFPAWSETAARYQYHQDLQRAQKEKAHRFT